MKPLASKSYCVVWVFRFRNICHNLRRLNIGSIDYQGLRKAVPGPRVSGVWGFWFRLFLVMEGYENHARPFILGGGWASCCMMGHTKLPAHKCHKHPLRRMLPNVFIFGVSLLGEPLDVKLRTLNPKL